MNAASIVFVHSVLDGAAFGYCRVTALVAPRDWESVVEKRGVTLAGELENILLPMLDKYEMVLVEDPVNQVRW